VRHWQTFVKIGQTVLEISKFFNFKMVAIRHLGFVGHILDDPQKVFGKVDHLVGIAAVVSLLQNFEHFASLA